jgi:hypothetical protein
MLFAYTFNTDASQRTLGALRAAVDDLNTKLLPPGYGLAPLWDAVAAEGVNAGSVRGYELDAERGHTVALIHALRQLSRRFPAVVISLSGGYGLPPTQIKDGHFEIFADAYAGALEGRGGWATPAERVLRIPS